MTKPCQQSKHAYPCQKHSVTRREFITGLGFAAAGLAMAGCQPKATVAPTHAGPAESAGAAPAARSADGQPTVAIAKASRYDPKLVKQQVQAVLDGIGGLSDMLAHGTRVAIKVNMTGGVSSKPLPGTTAIETYITHPEVVKALIELLRDAGAKDIFVVEAAYEDASWPEYGYTAMIKAAGAKIVDLTNAAPYKNFTKIVPGTDPMIYESYTVNPLLTELDAFVSVSKLKCHNIAGVTHSMKNLFGLVPKQLYTLKPNDTYRSAFHGQASETGKRVPKIIVDLNRARPVNLSLIDGIMSAEAGEGPWIKAFTPNKPGILLAGKNPVATDAVATAVMGFDPTADYPNEPFVNGNNHLKIAAQFGLGTNKLDEINVVGVTTKDATTHFKASY